ncbi:MAG: NTP transferase domain-containing protein [Vicinamibacterales bacterium]
MRGIILAAGKGSRLNGTAKESPKCLVELGGLTLIERQIRQLRQAGIYDIAVVAGCQADRVRRACGHGITYVENARYAQTNSMYSLWMARPLLYEGFVVLNCDVIFHPTLLDDLLSARHDNALLLAYREANQPQFGDEEMKVKVRCGRVVDMSKTMDPAEADGENLGIVKFGPSGAAALVDILDRLIGAGGLRDWAPRAFAEFAKAHPLHAIGTRGFPWIEIDFPEDYRRAAAEVLPRIERDSRMYPSSAPAWDGQMERRGARADRRGLSLARRTGEAFLADAS